MKYFRPRGGGTFAPAFFNYAQLHLLIEFKIDNEVLISKFSKSPPLEGEEILTVSKIILGEVCPPPPEGDFLKSTN
jgi:hypothetical protein